MQLSVSSNLASRPAFGLNINKPEVMANLSDKDIKDLAYKKTLKDVKENKHRAFQAAIYAGIPVVAGLAAAATSPKFAIRTIGKHSKTIADGTRLAKLSFGLNNAASWGAALLGGFAAFGLTKVLVNNSKKARDFVQNHPFISTVAGFVAAYGGYKGISKVGVKLIEKFASRGSDEAAKYVLKLTGSKGGIGVGEETLKFAKALNNNKYLNAINKQINKIPSAIKDFSKIVMSFSPFALIIGAFANSTKHNAQKVAAMYNNVGELAMQRKAAREMLAQGADAE